MNSSEHTGKDKISLIKEITVETDYKNNYYEMTVQSMSNNNINILLDFPHSIYENIKNNQLRVISGSKEISKEIHPDTRIKNLPKGNYKLLLNNNLLVKFGIK